MVMTLGRAIAWGLSGLVGVRHDELVAHRDLEHAHWDPVSRTWFTHEEAVVADEGGQRERLPAGTTAR